MLITNCTEIFWRASLKFELFWQHRVSTVTGLTHILNILTRTCFLKTPAAPRGGSGGLPGALRLPSGVPPGAPAGDRTTPTARSEGPHHEGGAYFTPWSILRIQSTVRYMRHSKTANSVDTMLELRRGTVAWVARCLQRGVRSML